jgi:TolB protein
MVHRPDETQQLYLFDLDRRIIVRSLADMRKPLTFSLSHDGLYGAFVAEQADQADIYAADLYAGSIRQITHSDDLEVFTSWSPDGMQLAFASMASDEAQHNVHILNLADGSSWKLTENLYGGNTPDWSPDGRYIVFVSGDSSDRANLFVVEADCQVNCDARQRQVTELLGSELMPSWSPDGKHIAFISIRLAQLGIYLVNTDCLYRDENCLLRNPRLLTSGNAIKSPLTWSADSRSIFFFQTENGQPEFYRLDINCASENGGCLPQRLTDLSRSFLKW